MALTQGRLKELMDYNPLTGLFTAKIRTGGRVVPGTILGTIKDGYVRISVDGKLYYAHQLAFLFVTGTIPAEIDHDDRDRSNNRWANLKAVTHSQNAINCAVRSHNKIGVKNVAMTSYGAFRVRLKRLGVIVFDKCFPTLDEAIVARDAQLMEA